MTPLFLPSFFSGRPFAGISLFEAWGASPSCSSTTFPFPLTFAGWTSRSGGANTRPLRVTPLSPVIFVALSDNELTSVASSSSPRGGACLHGTAWLFWYGKGTCLAAKGCPGFCEVVPLVNYITKGLGFATLLPSVDCMHICCSSLPSLPTSSHP